MPFALMEIFPRFGWTKSLNAARGERAAGAFVCSFFIIRSSLLLDLPVPPRFANAFRISRFDARNDRFSTTTTLSSWRTIFLHGQTSGVHIASNIRAVVRGGVRFVLDEAILSSSSSSSERSGSSSELDAYSLSFGINIGSMLLPPVPTLPM